MQQDHLDMFPKPGVESKQSEAKKTGPFGPALIDVMAS